MNMLALGFIAGFLSAVVGVVVGIALVLATRNDSKENDK